MSATKYCLYCKVDHPIDDFYKNIRSRDGRRHRCKKYYATKILIRRKTNYKIDQLVNDLEIEESAHEATRELLMASERKCKMYEDELKKWKTKYEIIMQDLKDKMILL